MNNKENPNKYEKNRMHYVVTQQCLHNLIVTNKINQSSSQHNYHVRRLSIFHQTLAHPRTVAYAVDTTENTMMIHADNSTDTPFCVANGLPNPKFTSQLKLLLTFWHSYRWLLHPFQLQLHLHRRSCQTFSSKYPFFCVVSVVYALGHLILLVQRQPKCWQINGTEIK